MLINKQYFKEMTLWQKIKYLLYYHGLHVFGAVILIVFLIFMLKPLMKKNNYNCINVLILNDTENDELVNQIKKGFSEYLNDEKYTIDVNNKFPFTYIEEDDINWPDQSTNFEILSLLPDNLADIAIADYKTMLWAVYSGFITPINNILPQEMFEILEPYYVYAYFQGYDKSDGNVYGLDISNTELYKNNSEKHVNAVIIIPKITNQEEAVIKFIEYLLN